MNRSQRVASFRAVLRRAGPHALAALAFLAASPARAAALTGPVNGWASGVPSYISMYIYVPDKVAANPPILVVSHFCGGSASSVFGQAQGGGVVAAADKYGFIMIFPQTTNPASSAKCWDVGSKASLTHDGGGDTQAVAEMVKYAVTTYHANPDRVYATGDSSGGMMTQALLAVYPDMFKAGSSFAGVPAGCWSAGWSAASNWGGTCAGGNDIMTAQQWGQLARGMYPSYTGHRPRVQLFHGDADGIINYKNFGEAIKEWTNVLGLGTSPTSTATGITLGSHQATRQQWKNLCGYVVLDAFTSIGGDHGPSDTLFNATYVIPFLGLDKTGPKDPEIEQCSTAGAGGAGGSGGMAGTVGGGGAGVAGAGGSGGSSGNGASIGGSGGSVTSGGSVGNGGSAGTAGTIAAGAAGSGASAGKGPGMVGSGGSGVSGATGAAGSAGTAASTMDDAASCSCAVPGGDSGSATRALLGLAAASLLLARGRGRSARRAFLQRGSSRRARHP